MSVARAGGQNLAVKEQAVYAREPEFGSPEPTYMLDGHGGLPMILAWASRDRDSSKQTSKASQIGKH